MFLSFGFETMMRLQLAWLTLMIVSAARGEITVKNRTTRPLVDHPACQGELISLAKECDLDGRDMRENDVMALACAQNVAASVPNAVTETCEQVLWSYKMDLTKGGHFLKDMKKYCRMNREIFESCYRLKDPGEVVSCVVDQDIDRERERHRINPRCSQFLTWVKTVIFSDYRMIRGFAEACKADIEGRFCGKISGELYNLGKEPAFHHSQGTVLRCLANHLQELKPECLKQTYRVAELQSNDYHLDRALFFACQEDREVLCPDVKSGDGRVFTCLFKAIADKGMSQECRAELERREKLVAADYKADFAVAAACGPEITRNKCEMSPEVDETAITRRSRILLCLEDVEANKEDVISDKCLAELSNERQAVMSDYNVSPELAVACEADVNGECRDKEEPGAIIHCLMAKARRGSLKSDEKCAKELLKLIKEVNLASNWALDPVIMRSCQEVVAQACPAKSTGQGEVMRCLLNELNGGNSLAMNDDCAGHLLEVQYFLARDFSLTPKLYGSCREDAERFCQATTDWHMKDDDDNDVGEKRYVFPCLVRHLYSVELDEDEDEVAALSPQCQDQVRLTLKRRSVSVNLHPEIEERCRAELAAVCPDVVDGKGKEIRCLQDNLETLSKDCKSKVVYYTRIQGLNANLNPDVVRSCARVIEDHCSAEATADKGDGSLMRCLLTFKEERDENEVMNPDYKNCERALNHWQKIASKDARFSAKFWQKCQREIGSYCNSAAPSAKWKIIDCLKEVARTKEDRISQGCQNEIKFQLLQKHSNYELNPEILSKCQREVETKCFPGTNAVEKGRVLECLKALRHEDLSPTCRRVLFKEELVEATFNSVDQYLTSTCKNEIKQFCQEGDKEPNGIVNCLKMAKDESGFGNGCRKVLRKRIIQQSKDYRLNPNLAAACEDDMKAHCLRVIQRDHSEDDFLEGKLLNCLTKRLMADRKSVKPQCRAEIRVMMRQAALDFAADPVLLQNCPNSINVCKAKVDLTAGEVDEDKGRIEECLKELFEAKKLSGNDGKCAESIARRIELESVDIAMDPLFKRACAFDMNTRCTDVPAVEVMRCLGDLWKSKKVRLRPKCAAFVEKRAGELAAAVREYPVESLNDLYHQLYASPHRNYFATVLASFVIGVFVFGLLCGRATRRARKQLINKVR